MWEAYWIGLFLGVGIGLGGIVAGLLAPRRALLAPVAILAAAAGAALGYALQGWAEAIAGGIGGVIGALAAAFLVAGTLGRGGTRGGTSALVVGSGVVLAGLAFIPVVGYLEAAAVPLLTVRARRRKPDRYAGLRTLALADAADLQGEVAAGVLNKELAMTVAGGESLRLEQGRVAALVGVAEDAVDGGGGFASDARSLILRLRELLLEPAVLAGGKPRLLVVTPYDSRAKKSGQYDALKSLTPFAKGATKRSSVDSLAD